MSAQSSYDDFKRRSDSDFEQFRNRVNTEYEEFRARVNAEYAEMLKRAWGDYDAIAPRPKPKDDQVPPVVCPDDDRDKPIKDNPKPFDEVVPAPKPDPQPQPVAPIEEKPQPRQPRLAFDFLGVKMEVRLGDSQRFSLSGVSANSVAATWKQLSTGDYDNTIYDCLQLRSNHKLCDWAYLLMLKQIADTFFPGKHNESTMLWAYLYCQSGYKMRFANDGSRLYMLVASKHIIYGCSYFDINGELFYPLEYTGERLAISETAFPQERSLSLLITEEMKIGNSCSTPRELQSDFGITARVSVNPDFIAFYESYPTSMIGDNLVSRWAMYANTPLEGCARNSLYPTLREAIKGKGQHDAVNTLLNFVQTAFEYEYDDKVWGTDRAFFAEESLYYPYCDCEDRSILFSHLVRELVGLNVVLVYYPGHLATAVEFKEDVKGDVLIINGRRFVVCDPTYIGAPVGLTMPKMNNAEAKVILLK